MSMAIDASNYQNINLQKEWSVDTEGKAKEAGKTQQSTVSASQDQIHMGEEGVAVNQVSRLQGAGQSSMQKRSAAPHTDIVEISEEGRAASAKMAALQTDSAAYAAAEAESEWEIEDLSEYTDTELKQMYYTGEITLQEYEDETGEELGAVSE